MNIRKIFLVTLAAATAACTSVPERNSALDQARTSFSAAQNNPQVATLAPEELKRAAESLQVAEQAATDHAGTATVNHLAYMTVQRIAIANDTASSKASQAVTAGAAAERDKLLLAVRTNEADMAQHQLALSEQRNARKSNELAVADANAERDQMRLALSTHETATAQQAADTAEQHLALSEQSNAQKTSELATADANAQRDQEHLALSEQSNAQKTSELVTADANAQRDQEQLALSEQSNAQKTSELATADANAQRDQEQLALSEQSNAQKTSKLATADANAQRNQEQLARSEQSNAQKTSELAEADATASRSNARVSDLESQLKELNAKKTDRGMVVTLGDVLFDTGNSQVLASASSNIAKLADFFKRNPQRTASIEGFTDNVGVPSANVDLSQRRANAVMTALIGLGVPADRLSTQAHGEDMPTADNGTAAGRQMNRRVEIVIPPRTEDVSMMQ